MILNLAELPSWVIQTLFTQGTTDLLIQNTQLGTKAFFDRGSALENISNVDWDESQKRKWVIESLTAQGKSFDAKNPFVDFMIDLTNSAQTLRFRVHGIFPPVMTYGIALSFRSIKSHLCFDHLKATLWSDDPAFSFLCQGVREGKSIIIAGSTGSGKTTLLNSLLSNVVHTERILALEEISELSPIHPHFISLLARPPNADGFGAVSLEHLIKQSLRMRPDRIVLGECRGAEVLDLLQILNTGHRGAMATLHANSARDAVKRLELLCLIGSRGILSLPVIREFIAGGLQWIVFVEKSGTQRKISEILQLEGMEGDILLLRPMIKQESYVKPSRHRLTL